MEKRKLKKGKLFVALLAVVAIALVTLEVGSLLHFDWGYHLDLNFFPSNPFVMPKIKIVDPDSDERPIAVMINTHNQAVPNHSGLQDAYLVYEIITEGGITRMMALFKGKNTERIGSVRSSRHYYLDYVLENDAIYAHFGFSERAKNDIYSLGIANVNGLYDSGFWRDFDLDVDYEHTAYTSIEGIKNVAEYRGYRMTSDKKLLLNYQVARVKMQDLEGVIPADHVSINYSSYRTTSYEYNPETKRYERYVNGEPHTDGITKEQYTTKNIITYQIYNYSFDNYGRQDLKNIGTGSGYYITEGYAVPIKWEKNSRSEQTKYMYLDGTELKVNDGNTFIQIQPEGRSLEITGNTTE